MNVVLPSPRPDGDNEPEQRGTADRLALSALRYAPGMTPAEQALIRAYVGCKLALEAIGDLPQETAEAAEEPIASSASASNRSSAIFPPLRVPRAERARSALAN